MIERPMRRELIAQAARFCIVGVMNTVVGLLAIYVNIFVFRMDDVAGNFLGYIFGLSFGFLFHRNWTFRARSGLWFGVMKYVLAFAFSYALNLVCVLGLRHLAVPSVWAQAGGVIPYVVSFFLLSKYLVFPETQPE